MIFYAGCFLCAFCRVLIVFKINFFEKLFQEYRQSVKHFGFKSEAKLFAKVISRRHTIVGKEFNKMASCLSRYIYSLNSHAGARREVGNQLGIIENVEPGLNFGPFYFSHLNPLREES